MQSLRFIVTAQGEKVFDVIHITSEHGNKDIYFDITSFYHEPVRWLMSETEYNTHRIKELYRKEK